MSEYIRLQRRRRSLESPPALRIALLGTSGSGKSASGNTILNFNNRFTENHSLHALPRSCYTETAEVDGRDILVIDTPGLFETSMDEDELIAEMKICAHQSSPGLHAFLLVIRLDEDLTDEETNIMEWIENFFGEDALRYTFILFTHADKLKNRSLDEFIRRRRDLKRLVKSCGGDRYHAFNNRNRQNRDQVIELIQKIERMVLNNGGHHNTPQEFDKSENSRLYWNRAKEAGTAAIGRQHRDEVTELIQKIERMVVNNGGHHKTPQEFEKSENNRFYWKVAKGAGIVIGVGGLVVLGGVGVGALAMAKGGGVVLAKKAGLAVFGVLAAAATGIGIYTSTQQRHHAHSY